METPSVGIKNSRRRNAVLKAFSASGEHLTIDEVYERARKIDPKIGYTTVWRTLKLLESCGLAASRKFHDGLIRYECTDETDHHDHLICTGCGTVQEFVNPQIEEIQKRVAKTHEFSMTAHRMELYGLCSRCSKGKKAGKRKTDR